MNVWNDAFTGNLQSTDDLQGERGGVINRHLALNENIRDSLSPIGFTK